MHSEIVRLEGHIIDSLTLSRVLDLILLLGGSYDIAEFRVGQTRGQSSMARIQVSAPTAELLDQILHEIGQHGAERTVRAVRTIPAPEDGVFPEGFYSTTNLRTAVYLDDRWLAVEGCEMDCGIVIAGAGAEARAICVRSTASAGATRSSRAIPASAWNHWRVWSRRAPSTSWVAGPHRSGARRSSWRPLRGLSAKRGLRVNGSCSSVARRSSTRAQATSLRA